MEVPGKIKTPTHLEPEERTEERGEKKAITPGNREEAVG